MCGINVLFENNKDRVRRMNEAVSHRGIRSNIESVGPVTLGHVRLPIQGLDPRHDQPYFNREDRTGWVFVGEVFNYRELDPEAETDVPVLARMHSENRMREVDGFWSAAYFDQWSGRTTVLSDPLGKKPLYARMRGEDRVWAISSEMKPLIDLGPVTPNDLYYSMILKWGYCILNQTPFMEIVKLDAGRTYVLGPTGTVLETHQPRSLTPVAGDLPELLRTAVKNRTVSDVPISVLLSGGLDSTIVFELLKETGVPFTVYHVDNDESEYLSCLNYPDNVTVKKLALDDVSMDDLIQVVQVPVDLGSVLPQYLLGRAIRGDGCSVALSGDGADELFGGYRRSMDYDSQYSDVFNELVHYHLPRLDSTMMASTVELRCPYLSLPVVRHALSLPWNVRTQKQHLKKSFPWIAESILKRDKKPLKIRQVREKPIEYRKKLVERHRRIYFG